DELVADPVDGGQVTRATRVGLELAAQVHHMGVDGALERVVIENEGGSEQPAAAEDVVRPGHELAEDPELGGGAVDGPPGQRDRVPGLVEDQGSGPQPRGL